MLALTRYRPRFYSGKIKFVRAEISTAFPDDAAAVWEPLAQIVEVETIPGDHLGIIALDVTTRALRRLVPLSAKTFSVLSASDSRVIPDVLTGGCLILAGMRK